MKVGKDGWLPVNRKTGIDITGEFEIRSPESLLLISDNNNPTHDHGILTLCSSFQRIPFSSWICPIRKNTCRKGLLYITLVGRMPCIAQSLNQFLKTCHFVSCSKGEKLIFTR